MSKNEKKDFIEFRTLRASKRNNTGTVIIITPASSGDMIFEMANLLTFNDSGKPTFNYDKKTVFGLDNFEAARVSMAIGKFLSNPNRPIDKIELPHLETKIPKRINFNFSKIKDEKAQIERAQMQVSVYHDGTDDKYNIYLNEAEMYCVKQFLDSQINPSLKRITIESYNNREFREEDSQFKDLLYGIIEKIEGMIGFVYETIKLLKEKKGQ